MNRMHTVILLLILSNSVFAQLSEDIKFDGKIHDFGTIDELDGPVEHEFIFTNVSPDTILIKNVKASCGCTTPGWTTTPVLPGENGFVKAKYNPINRPGAFNKFLTIKVEGKEHPLRLFIKGVVSPKPGDIRTDLPVKSGQLRTLYRSLNLGRIYTRDTAAQFTYDLYNDGDTVLKFKDEILSPGHIVASVKPQELQPEAKGKLILRYNAKQLNDVGFRTDNVTFYTYEAGQDSIKSFSVYANLLEYFEPMTEEELENAPFIAFDRSEEDFERVKEGIVLKTKFTIFNKGKEKLVIRKITGNCSCVQTKLEKTEILPGEEVVLPVELHTKGRSGRQQKSVVVYSNSPQNPVSRLTLNVYVTTD